MSKLFAICRMTEGGTPDLDFATTPMRGYVLCGELSRQFGAYLFAGTNAQLTALNALPAVTGIVAVTQVGDVKWAELDGTVPPALRTKLNSWLTARSMAYLVPAGAQLRVVVKKVFGYLNKDFEFEAFDVDEGNGKGDAVVEKMVVG